MTDVMIPPWLKMAKVGFRYRDSTGISRPEFTGFPRTAAKGGDRLTASLEFTPQGTSSTDTAVERAALIAFLVDLEGKQNRAYLTNPARRLRGSFPASELFTNNTFANGTTGWSNSRATLSVHDRVLRMAASQVTSSVEVFQNVALTQNVPHVLRAMIMDGRGTAGLLIGPSITSATFSSSSYTTERGLRTVSAVPEDGTARGMFPAVISNSFGYLAGDYLDVPWCSLSRCALVDNGQNALLRSDEFDNAAWSKAGCTISANADVAPDGTTTADRIVESALNETHVVSQAAGAVSSAAADHAIGISAQPNGRDWILLQMREGTGSTDANIWFNVTTGAIGTISNGANWSNVRGFIVNRGNGWFDCHAVARKTNAATVIETIFRTANADAVQTYAGNGSSGIRVWRATRAQSSVPTRLVQTVGSALPTGTAQVGRVIHIKGLPVSTNGLLLKGDEVEIITSYGSELKIVTASLNSDAAGLGYLQFKPAIRGVLSDSSPVIVFEPMGKFIFSGEMVGWDNEPGVWTSASAEFEEAA